eukprot:CAMPEP_0115520632 /NCGR_PEP_ID=MMETSP0271-20121206/79094_1 /TAXON_ID=71861 /ORGANISM="Scrippsiella trochoidea, Strain CCMP3099" /LENGTH=33 /DNA_ID= /DNA_START= /DNA_END= /DNA_ORIENTATION=
MAQAPVAWKTLELPPGVFAVAAAGPWHLRPHTR